MSANPGGGDHVPESPSEATMSNERATIEALRAEVARLRRLTRDVAEGDGFTTQIDGALIVKCDTYGKTDLHRRAEALVAKVEYWQDRALAAEADAATAQKAHSHAINALDQIADALGLAFAEVDAFFLVEELPGAVGSELKRLRQRAETAEADAATLSEKLAARATVRHNLDPTQP